jgi:hypothetical protein
MSIQPALGTAAPAAGTAGIGAVCLVDSHCHIVFRNYDEDLEAVASRWRQANPLAQWVAANADLTGAHAIEP